MAAGYETTADFIAAADGNTFKVCETPTNNLGNLAGQTFWYNISWTFTPPNGAAPISNTGGVGVVAVAAPGTACTVVGNGDFDYGTSAPLGIPVGSKVWVTEGDSVPDVMVTDAWVTPALADAGSAGATAVLTIQPNPTVAGSAGRTRGRDVPERPAGLRRGLQVLRPPRASTRPTPPPSALTGGPP